MSRREGVPHRTLLLVVGLLLALVAVLRSGETLGGHDVRPSSLLSSPGGARALYLVAQELGLDVERWRRPLDALQHEPGVAGLVLLSPAEGLTRAEAEGLLDWVAAGGQLLYAPPRRGRDQLLVALGTERVALREGVDAHVATDLAPWVAALAEGVAPRSRGWGFLLTLDEPAERVLLPEAGAARKLAPRQAHVAEHDDEDELVAAFAREHGAGRVMLLADARPLVNEQLAEGGLAPLVLRVLAEFGAGGALLFDEYHHGFDEQAGLLDASWRFLSTTPVGWAILSLALLVLVALLCAGVRLGAPLPAAARPGRSSLEHVTALAAAYRAAGERQLPVHYLLEGFRLALGTRDAASCRDRLAGLLSRSPELARSVATIEAAAAGTAADPVALSQAIDAVLRAAHQAPGAPILAEPLRV